MILVRDYFQSFTDRPIGDPAGTVSAATAIFLDDREAVDATLADGIAAGGSEAHPAAGWPQEVTSPVRAGARHRCRSGARPRG